MPFFNNTPDDWQRLDCESFATAESTSTGVLNLIEDSQWFAQHGYNVFQFACDPWESRDTIVV